jgi:hypothetical protein
MNIKAPAALLVAAKLNNSTVDTEGDDRPWQHPGKSDIGREILGTENDDKTWQHPGKKSVLGRDIGDTEGDENPWQHPSKDCCRS